MTRRFAGSDLVRSTRAVAESVLTSWPELIPAATPASAQGASVGADGEAGIEKAEAPTMEGIGS